jgi:hypothetical protein
MTNLQYRSDISDTAFQVIKYLHEYKGNPFAVKKNIAKDKQMAINSITEVIDYLVELGMISLKSFHGVLTLHPNLVLCLEKCSISNFSELYSLWMDEEKIAALWTD